MELPPAASRRALVLGGTGAVGGAVLRGLAAAGVPTAFTYCRSAERARALAATSGQQALPLDLRDRDAIRGLFAGLAAEGRRPDLLIHCAAVTRAAPLAEVSDDDWDAAYEVNARAAFVAVRALVRGAGEGADVVLCGALDRGQSLPLPVPFAATQGMLAALTMALARELGPRGVRVNMVALGVLEGGLSRVLSPGLIQDYRHFSALRRLGTPDEAARAVLWLALENRYMTGKVLPINGGIG